jgi:hypothetical protein
MQKPFIAICVLCASSILHAQHRAANWENLNTLNAGDRIQVHELNSTKVSGTFLSVSDASIFIEAHGASQAIQKQEVERVTLMKNKHRLRNPLGLAGVGAGVGAGIGAADDKHCPATQTFCLDFGEGIPSAIGGVIGLLGGAITGALLPSHQTVYTVNAH